MKTSQFRVPMPAAATRTERLRLKLEEEILAGRLRPGTRLDEEGIARRFGVSRTPVREAFKALASAGLVEIRPHQGAHVAVLTLKDIVEMLELMGVLEGACAEFAARRHTAADRAAVLAAREACEAARTPSDYYAANARLHEAIYAAAHNTYLAGQTVALRHRLEPYRRQVTTLPGLIETSNREHRAVVEAILRADGEAASSAMRAHVATLRDDIAAMVEAVAIPA
ncbi:GntR family transcriptional regulator [Rhodoplanes sp. SY1]|uniref:GntR family transcriptional regulator n=1 Tax=Rhodoplanes sp. SY1 TaxID=3166646 RepID=UPI0038B69307